ncbi:hypothetical protein FHY55_10085 [Oceanicola sp. D3]|uniref:hypothetical protein n=1 Tax=Oceanicola sp. D3 TaxID=2587163 RepID=UPI00112338AD|nr:hypothetical protein [Oceanicola sp. D3]QDC09569.1 hypothetical protein FHY55_10085 [Oceanicola sp. D3]
MTGRGLIAALVASAALFPSLIAPVTGQSARAGWAVSTDSAKATCTAALTSEEGAALAIHAPAVAEARPDTPGFALQLWLTPSLRELLPLPDGEVALAFRPAGSPAVQLEGTLAPDAAFWRFNHPFASVQDAARFILATRSGRLTLFHPEAGVLAGFDTKGAEEALALLLACDPAPEPAE